jgi:hypothetical protein
LKNEKKGDTTKENDKITSETAPDNSFPDNLSDQTDCYVTRSGRISKPPDKLNL